MTDISGVRDPEIVVRGRGDGGGMSDGDAQGLPGTFGPGPMVVQTEGDIVAMRWQALVEVSGRGRMAVRVSG